MQREKRKRERRKRIYEGKEYMKEKREKEELGNLQWVEEIKKKIKK